MENNNTGNVILKLIIGIAVVIYVVSPVDFFPGPIDDFIALLIGLAVNRNE